MATVSTATRPQSVKPPSRPGHFLLGVLPEFRRDPLGLFVRAAREQGDVARLRLAFQTNYQISHPDDIKRVLQMNQRNYRRAPYSNRLVMMVSGLNLLTSDGQYWLSQRRMMQPAFHKRRIAGFGQIMTDATVSMLEEWDRAAQSGEMLDMHDEMMRLTMEVVGQTLFSVDLSAESNLLGEGFTTSIEYMNYRFKHPFAAPLFIPTRRNRKLKRAMKNMSEIMQNMIDERRQSREQKDDLMAMLMEARDEETGEGMNDEQLRNELTIMIGAGHETTSNALTWTFYLLSEHPDAEEKLLAELKSVLAGRTPTINDLPNLPYTRMVIQESMRIYPPAWGLSSRQAIADDQLGGYHIPANSVLMIMPYVVHRDPRFWNNPEKFEPERFTPERSKKRHKFAYLPFGNGPRKCIGATFALIEAQLILATILQRYKLRLKPHYNVEPTPIFTLRVKDGLPMSIQRR
ncbi:MAG: cytochrome P450 [Ardenticatenaceae bacterium]